MDIQELHIILENHKVSIREWDRIKENHRFQMMLEEATRQWASADNIEKRVKTKLLSALEESTPEMYARLHDKAEPLSAKVELWKAIQRGAGIGIANGVVEGGGAERFQLVINIGEGQEHKITAKTVLPAFIEGEKAVVDD